MTTKVTEGPEVAFGTRLLGGRVGIRSTRVRANSPTPTGELAYVGEFDQRHRRVRCS